MDTKRTIGDARGGTGDDSRRLASERLNLAPINCRARMIVTALPIVPLAQAMCRLYSLVGAHSLRRSSNCESVGDSEGAIKAVHHTARKGRNSDAASAVALIVSVLIATPWLPVRAKPFR
jgi:hypothetical protein